MSRLFLRALPADDLPGYGGWITPSAASAEEDATAAARGGLLVAIEQVALGRGDLAGARQAYDAAASTPLLRGVAASLLAEGEVRAGLPRQAVARLPLVDLPSARFGLLCALVAVKPWQDIEQHGR